MGVDLRVPCAVRWCVCLAQIEGVCCVVHAVRGEMVKPLPIEIGQSLVDENSKGDCDSCGGEGECIWCHGTGEHECGECSDVHRCVDCRGSGECIWCHGTGWERSTGHRTRQSQIEAKQDVEYLRWAFDSGLKPLPPLFDTPWGAQERDTR